jgi:hypothetical protein
MVLRPTAVRSLHLPQLHDAAVNGFLNGVLLGSVGRRARE